MTTLAAVNNTLVAQNEVLLGIAKNTDRTGDRLESFLAQFKTDRLKNLEKERESKRSAAGMVQAAAGSVNQERKRISAGLGGFFDKLGLGSGLGAGAALGFLTAAGTRLVTRGIPGLLAIGFADEIADYLLGPDGEGDVKKAIEGAITGGAIGALFGLRAGIIGALLGGLASNEGVQTQLKELETNVTELLKGLGINIDGSLAKTGLSYLTTTITDGLKGVNAILKGDFTAAADNIGATLTLLASLGFLLSPRAGLALAFAPLAALAKTSKGRAVIAMATAAMAAAGLKSFDDQGIGAGGNNNQNVPGGNDPGENAGIDGPDLTTYGAVVAGGVVADMGLKKALELRNNKKPSGVVTKQQLVEIVKKNNQKVRMLQGIGVDGKKVSTFIPRDAKLEDYLDNPKLRSKYPKLFKYLTRFMYSNPITAALLTTTEIAFILNDDSLTTKQKAAQIGGSITGVVGAAAMGAAAAGILGLVSAGPVGMAVGVIAGAGIGYVTGNMIGVAVMEFLLDASVTEDQAQVKLKKLSSVQGIVGAVALENTEISTAIATAAVNNNMDPARLYALAEKESSFNPKAIGDSGQSIGLFQLKKGAVNDVNRIYGTNYKPEDRLDPMKAADIAAKYYNAQMTQYGAGSEFNAARFYNQGPGGGSSSAAQMVGQAYARDLENITNNYEQKIDQSVNSSSAIIMPDPSATPSTINIRDGSMGTVPRG